VAVIGTKSRDMPVDGTGPLEPQATVASSTSQMNGTINLASQSRLFAFSLKGNKALKDDFERVAIPHLSHIYTAARYFTQDEHEAEDLVQETYFRAYRFFHKFEPGTNCRAWLLSIQRHLFINRYRQTKRQPEFVDWERIERDYESLALSEDRSEKYNPETLFCSQVMGPEVEKALKELPEEFRTAIVLVDIDELTYDEVAQILECPIGTVRSRLSRGRRMLQVALRNYALERSLTKK
jgi:RNA polymerase sigma-70 factor, ECF subfamily